MVKTRVVVIDPAADTALWAGEIARALREGSVAAYPTETFYALGAAAFSKRAIGRIYRLKEREASKPLSVIASDLDMVGEISASPGPAFLALAGEFWPGPLTIVLKAAAGVPDFLLGPGRTIAVRIPPLTWLRSIVREVNEPVTATSANLSGEKEMADPAEVAAAFNGKVDLIVDGGHAPGGLPSTVVDLASDRPRILREGRIPAAKIQAVLGA